VGNWSLGGTAPSLRGGSGVVGGVGLVSVVMAYLFSNFSNAGLGLRTEPR
jgi:hypothetical protein